MEPTHSPEQGSIRRIGTAFSKQHLDNVDFLRWVIGHNDPTIIERAPRLPNAQKTVTIWNMHVITILLPYIQAALSVLLIVAVLLQVRGSSVGGAFGGGDADTTFYTRRGGERALFISTIVLGVAFALSAFIALFIHQ